jgi:hypothetical protein
MSPHMDGWAQIHSQDVCVKHGVGWATNTHFALCEGGEGGKCGLAAELFGTV